MTSNKQAPKEKWEEMMNKTIYAIMILLFAVLSCLRAQTPNPLSFFPHHLGDVWEYRFVNSTDYEQNRITKDSLGTDGRYYIETTRFGKMRIDTSTYEVHGRQWGGPGVGEYDNLIYKLASNFGDEWTVSRTQFYVLKAHIVGVYYGFVLDTIVQVKEIDVIDSISRLLLTTDYLASSLGLIGQDNDGFPVSRIQGVRINGVQRGIVTAVRESNPSTAATSFVLRQNYPNPFNPLTTLEYELREGSAVELKVFNVQGKELRTLDQGYKAAGMYRVVFDAHEFSTGAYIYSLKTPSAMQSRTMLILR